MPEAPRTPFFFIEKRKEEEKKNSPRLFSQDGKKGGWAGIERGFEKKTSNKNKNGREMARCVREKGER